MAWSLRNPFVRVRPEAAPAQVRNEVVTGLSWADFQRLFFLETHSGANVTPESAMRAIPVQACCTLIAGGITSMPLRIVQRTIEDGSPVLTPADDHPYWWLFNEEPNSDHTSAHLWEEVVKRKLLWGRGFARMIRKAGGRSIEIDEIVFVPNEHVQIDRQWDPAARRWRITRYIVRDGVYTYGVAPEDMLDFRGIQAMYHWAMSDILWSAREAIGICLTVEEYCGKFFANGGMPRTVLQYPQGSLVGEKEQNLLREAWARKYGGAENAGLPLILSNGGTAAKLSFTAEEAQMLEARKFQVIEIARAFGVPPFMIGETEKSTAWGTGLEQLGLAFIRYTLGPHITAIEQEINRKVFRISRYFVDFDEDALARGDMAALGTWFRQAVGGSNGPGFMTVDEIRRRLKMPPIEGGDKLYDPTGDSNASGSQSTDGPPGTKRGPPAPVRGPPAGGDGAGGGLSV